VGAVGDIEVQEEVEGSTKEDRGVIKIKDTNKIFTKIPGKNKKLNIY
jgi:hypothetical protein